MKPVRVSKALPSTRSRSHSQQTVNDARADSRFDGDALVGLHGLDKEAFGVGYDQYTVEVEVGWVGSWWHIDATPRRVRRSRPDTRLLIAAVVEEGGQIGIDKATLLLPPLTQCVLAVESG